MLDMGVIKMQLLDTLLPNNFMLGIYCITALYRLLIVLYCICVFLLGYNGKQINTACNHHCKICLFSVHMLYKACFSLHPKFQMP